MPISGLNIGAASPSTETAKSIQRAMTSSDVSNSIFPIDSKRFADAVISPELRRTMEELHKALGSSPQMEAFRKQHRQGCDVTAMEFFRTSVRASISNISHALPVQRLTAMRSSGAHEDLDSRHEMCSRFPT